MVKFNIEKLLEDRGKTKYWLCQKMNITSRNINRLINGKTTSISFKYIEEFCKYLECDITDLVTVTVDKQIEED